MGGLPYCFSSLAQGVYHHQNHASSISLCLLVHNHIISLSYLCSAQLLKLKNLQECLLFCPYEDFICLHSTAGDDGCSIDEPISTDDALFENTLQKLFVSDEGFARAHIRAFFARFDVSIMMCEREGRKESNSDCAIPIPKELL